MSFNANAASLLRMKRFESEKPEANNAASFAQYTLLDEMPGLIFGLMTVVYIVTALVSLA